MRLAMVSVVQVRNQRRMSKMLTRLRRRVEILATTRSADGVAANFAARAMRSIHKVVEYPSTTPEPGVGSIFPVSARVRAKPRVMAESSQVRYQKRQATMIWARRAMTTSEREIKTVVNGTFCEAVGPSVAGTCSEAALISEGSMQDLSPNLRSSLDALLMCRSPIAVSEEFCRCTGCIA
jgi:hypothetical protein